MGDARPAHEYLVACSNMSLESFQISRMNQAANLRKQVRALVDQWIEAEVDAGLSRWMLECRRTGAAPPGLRLDCCAKDKTHADAADSFRRGRVQTSAFASPQHCLTTGPAEAEDGRGFPSLENGTAVLDDCQNPTAGRAKEMKNPDAKPLARRYLAVSAQAAGAVVVSIFFHPQAQHELFEFGGASSLA